MNKKITFKTKMFCAVWTAIDLRYKTTLCCKNILKLSSNLYKYVFTRFFVRTAWHPKQNLQKQDGTHNNHGIILLSLYCIVFNIQPYFCFAWSSSPVTSVNWGNGNKCWNDLARWGAETSVRSEIMKENDYLNKFIRYISIFIW